MAKTLNSTVHVHNPKGETRVFKPGDDVPKDWAKLIDHDAAWDDDGVEEAPQRQAAPRDPGTPPPMSGMGSGAEVWALYAAEVDVDIPEGATRDQIVEAIKAADKPVTRDGA